MTRRFKTILWGTAGLLSLVMIQAGQSRTIKMKATQLFYPDLPKELDHYRMVHISDLHGARFGRENQSLVRRIMALEPDVVCMTGDMVHGSSDDGEALRNLVSGLDQKLVKLMVSGNHENGRRTLTGIESLNRATLFDSLTQYNVRLLDGQSWQVPGLPLIFSGLPDRQEHYQGLGFNEARFDPADHLPAPVPDCFNVALVHRPNYFRSIARYGFDLMLSGHTHGGVIRIGSKGLLAPERSFFPELDQGLFAHGAACLHVTSGLGQIWPIPRVNNQPEIALLVLRRGTKAHPRMKRIAARSAHRRR
ncbi:Calcineurin-like phosphoesterase [anaerobic digester metagenome]